MSGLVPGESMQLRDLVRGGDPVRVLEKLGSQGLRQWDRVATRVIPMRASAVISGTLMPFDQDTSEALLASLRKARTKAPREVAKVAQEFGIETDAKTLAGMMTRTCCSPVPPSWSRISARCSAQCGTGAESAGSGQQRG